MLKDIEPILARDAFDGFAILRAIPDIQLVILDNKLPYVDGIELLRKIRSLSTFRNLTVLMSSSDDIFDKYKETGADHVMIKPYNLTELLDYIAKIKDQNTSTMPSQ